MSGLGGFGYEPSALVGLPLATQQPADTPAGPKKRGRPPAAVWEHFTPVGEVKSSTKRRPARCNFCGRTIDSRVEALLKHVVRDCPKVSPEARQKADNDLQIRQAADKTAGSDGGTKPKKEAVKPRPLTGAKPSGVQALVVGQPGSEQVGVQQLRFFLRHDLPLSVADSPALLELVKALRPRLWLVDAARLENVVVNEEYSRLVTSISKRVGSETCVTLAASNCVLLGSQYIFGCSILLSDKSSNLLSVLEGPSEDFPAANLFGILKDSIDKVGSDRVAAIVTDGGNTLRIARQQLVTTEHYTHILELRCHAFALCEVVASILSHPWAQSLILDGYNLVLHINNSTELLSMMLQAIGASTSSTTMLPPMTRAITSVYPCLSALMSLESAIRILIQHHQVALATPETKQLLMTFSSANLGVLVELLEQFHGALTALQGGRVLLADITRHWVYIARVLDTLKSRCPAGFVEHCEATYHGMAMQMDTDMCRLALFLDPRFKHVASTRTFHKLLQHAVSIMKKRGHGKEECQQLIQQLQQYKAGVSPYDLPCCGENFNNQAWWLSLMAPATAVVVSLAMIFCDIVPYTAPPSRLLASMGWFPPRRKEAEEGPLACKMAILRAHYDAEDASALHVAAVKAEPAVATQAPSTPWAPPDPVITYEELARVLRTWQTRYVVDRPPSGMPFTGMLLACNWEGIDMDSPLLNPHYVPQENPETQQIGGLGSFTDTDFDAAQLVQQYTMSQA